MTAPLRVAPQEVRERVQSGDALLVCAYDDDSKFQRVPLDGAIPLSEFKSKISALPKDQEIYFYCA